MSEAAVSVHQAWAAVMGDVQAVRKGDRNSQHNFNFRGIDAVMNAVGPAMRRHGVYCAPVRIEPQWRDAMTTGGKPARECLLVVTFRVTGPAGDWFEGQAPGESLDSGDKATPKAMSVAYRTFLLQSLTIPTDDPDPDSHSYEREVSPRLSAPEPNPNAAPSQRERARMFALAGQKFAADEDFKAWLADKGFHGSRKDLTALQTAWVTNQLKALPNLPAGEKDE